MSNPHVPMNGWLEATRETDRRSHDMSNSISKFIEEQHDAR